MSFNGVLPPNSGRIDLSSSKEALIN